MKSVRFILATIVGSFILGYVDHHSGIVLAIWGAAILLAKIIEKNLEDTSKKIIEEIKKIKR